MFIRDDEEGARAHRVGALTHRVIGDLLSAGGEPTGSDFMAAADRCLCEFRPIEARAHRQNIAAGAAAYFWRLRPPTSWLFTGRELRVGPGRLDLVWADPDGRVLIDELKTGSPRQLLLHDTRSQVRRYLTTGARAWGEEFVGVRLLSTTDPARSLFISPADIAVPLRSTPYLRAGP